MRTISFALVVVLLFASPLALADNIASFSVGPTIATMSMQEVPGLEILYFPTTWITQSTTGHAGVSANGSTSISWSNGVWTTEFGGGSGWAKQDKVSDYNRADLEENAEAAFYIQNQTSTDITFQVTESLSMQGATSSGFSSGYWKGWGSVQSSVGVSTPFNSPITDVSLDCYGSSSYDFCSSFIYLTPSGILTTTASGNSMTTSAQYLVPAGAQFDLFASSAVDGFAVAQNTEPPPVPEPGTLSLLGSGLLGLAALAWRRSRPVQAQ
jgi:hypothetical protein